MTALWISKFISKPTRWSKCVQSGSQSSTTIKNHLCMLGDVLYQTALLSEEGVGALVIIECSLLASPTSLSIAARSSVDNSIFPDVLITRLSPIPSSGKLWSHKVRTRLFVLLSVLDFVDGSWSVCGQFFFDYCLNTLNPLIIQNSSVPNLL